MLRFFGTPRIEGPDGALGGEASQRHRLALLALLTTAPEGLLARDRIQGMLWPETDQTHARRLLNNAVHAVRKALGEDVLLSEADGLRLNPSAVRVDVLEFEAALETRDADKAVSRYTGPFLDGLALPDAVEFDQWADRERDRLDRLYHVALEQVAEAAASRGDTAESVRRWRLRLACTPADGRIVLQLMRRLVDSGDRAGALHEAAQHATLLREEFGVAAEPAVQSFVAQLRTAQDEAFPRAVAAHAVSRITVSPHASVPTPGVETPGGVDRTRRRRSVVRTGSIPVLALVGVVLLLANVLRTRQARPSHEVRPVTTFPGFETHPAVSPDGGRVVFAWDAGRSGPTNLYVVGSNGGTPVRLTDGPTSDYQPAWSPAGAEIAFLRRRPNSPAADIMIMPAIGGPVRQLFGTRYGRGLDWSPDGRWLAFTDIPQPADGSTCGYDRCPPRVFVLSVQTGNVRQITHESAEDSTVFEDTDPVFSPDGRHIAFVRRVRAASDGTVYVQDIDKNSAPRRVSQRDRAWDLDWSPDGNAVIVSTGEPSNRHLLRIPLATQKPERLASGSGAMHFSIARKSGALVYAEHYRQNHDLWRIPGPSTTESKSPEKVVQSTSDDFMPAYSPDGKRLVFVSARSGEWEAWLSDADGTNQTQLTNLRHALFPTWSIDGRSVLFSSVRPNVPGAVSDVFVMDAGGGFPRNLTADRTEDAMPSWAPDGEWIYYQSQPDSTGWQLWRKPAAGGAGEHLADGPALRPQAAHDGNVYYSREGLGIWGIPRDGGPPQRVIPPPVVWTEWTIWKDALIYLQHSDSTSSFRLRNLTSGKDSLLTTLLRLKPRGSAPPVSMLTLAVSPDGSWIVYSAPDRTGSDLVLVTSIR